ncbi:glucosamine 6-phosphate N-acetyltransferase [Histoplasma capsulatum]|uniref:Glucosamine 6-phosphate N-acetyltransferase n=1 Tax=Ajellomyces capsulatus TaxID=5037 RepID=A0A8A1M0U0_AJECA|nr:glucosamine 6-phosphate acetyltransferase [Histoplasma mississippiense (nom. inval.)]EDN06641.1 glucosamine 6-phosphate acetyltransferase [Histoplasma mississippiense (nom. inval.)]QSS59591.1 glucosamine 6-phosphate N-acetyltransferase [Histoplasma capsulatum]
MTTSQPTQSSIITTKTATNGDNTSHIPSAAPMLSPPASSHSIADDDDDAPLFCPSYISPMVQKQLPENYTIRPLRRSDYFSGYLDVLRVLTAVGDFTVEQWNERYDWMAKRGEEYFLLVICDGSGRVVSTGSLIVERKFIHSLGMVGHVEDIAVEMGQQGKKLGLRMIQALDFVAQKVGCYKSILDCSEANEGFYLKCGFKRAGLEMAHYYN